MRGANCSRAEAIDLLARELGLENGNGSQSAQGKKASESKKRDYAAEFEQALRTKAPPEAMDYLERRGLMGVLPELQERRLIGFKSGSENFSPAIVIPVMTLDRQIVGLQYIPCDGGDKKFAAGTEPGTYKDRGFLPICRGSGPAVLVEAAIDAFSAMAADPEVNVVALFSAGFTDKVERFSGDSNPPIMFFDRDDAGVRAAAEASRILKGHCRVVDWSLAPEDCKDPNDLLVRGHDNVIRMMIREAKTPEFEETEEADESDAPDTLADLGRPLPPAPPFPLECLPRLAADYAVDEAERMQSPVDLMSVPMLGTFAGLVGKDAAIKPKVHDNWFERPCLWMMLIASVSAMKSANISKATAPLRAIQGQLAKEDEERLKRWREKAAETELREKAWEKQCERVLRSDPDAELPPRPQAMSDLPEEPKPRRILTNDATIEKLADLMEGSRGMTLLRDELAGFLLNMSRYNNGSDRQFYLECYSGGSYSVDRVVRGAQFVSDLYLNIMGGIQPDVARKLLAGDSELNDGFFERFGLAVFPEPGKDYVLVDRPPDRDLRDSFNDLCSRLACSEWALFLHVDDYHDKPYAQFDEVAQEIFNDWLVAHMKELKSMKEGDPMLGMMGKARGLLVRLILVIHLASWAGGEVPDPKVIGKTSLLRGLKLLEDYLIPMWRRVFAAFSRNPSDGGAARIAAYILETRVQDIRIRDILKKGWKGLATKEAVEEALSVLVEHGWLLEPERLTRGGARGGRKTVVYAVNPRVFEENQDA
jgi:DNA primase